MNEQVIRVCLNDYLSELNTSIKFNPDLACCDLKQLLNCLINYQEQVGLILVKAEDELTEIDKRKKELINDMKEKLIK